MAIYLDLLIMRTKSSECSFYTHTHEMYHAAQKHKLKCLWQQVPENTHKMAYYFLTQATKGLMVG